jgi:hypothetical protein
MTMSGGPVVASTRDRNAASAWSPANVLIRRPSWGLLSWMSMPKIFPFGK